jgi:uncharacterized protein YukE
MSDITSYNYGMIESGQARLAALTAQFDQTAEDITKSYNMISDSSSGKAVDAGVAFNQTMTQARTAVSDLTTQVNQGIGTAQASNAARDVTGASHMG